MIHPRLLTAAIIAATFLTPVLPVRAQSIADLAEAGSKREIETVVRNLLKEHPEIVRDALLALQVREEADRNLDRVKVISEEASAIFDDPNAPVLGNPEGKLVMVEFLDYNCGYCKRAHADVMRLVEENDNLKIVVKQLPLLGTESIDAAHVALAVHKVAPEKFPAFHSRLYTSTGPVDLARAIAVAEALGIDPGKLRPHLLGPQIAAAVSENVGQASRLQLTGTPVFITQNDIIIGAMGYDYLKGKLQTLAASAK
ncbi:DsbA family protein [Microvirga tunisiensis]|nr:DsbA family protein [Microvirga tunisiensis]